MINDTGYSGESGGYIRGGRTCSQENTFSDRIPRFPSILADNVSSSGTGNSIQGVSCRVLPYYNTNDWVDFCELK